MIKIKMNEKNDKNKKNAEIPMPDTTI